MGRIRVVDDPDPFPERWTKVVTVDFRGGEGTEPADPTAGWPGRNGSEDGDPGNLTTEGLATGLPFEPIDGAARETESMGQPFRGTTRSTSTPGGSSETQHPLAPYLPRLVIDWITTAPDERHQEQVGTVAFVDISGFTKLSEGLARHGKVGAEELTATIGTCFVTLLDLAVAYGGRLLKFGGDALLLFFSGESHEARAAAPPSRCGARCGRSGA